MRKTLSLLTLLATVGALVSGCSNMERKMGRGLNNTLEALRGGEFRRTMEQTALFDSPDEAYTTGFVRGFNRSLARTSLGIYEVLTFPLPPYDPILTDHLTPNPVYPDNYKPGLVEDSMFATDTAIGFSGGDIAPMIPGSRFQIFDTH